MCDELTMRPRAIYAHELSDKQLSKLYRINKNSIMCAWRTVEGIMVYLEGAKPNSYLWKKRVWQEVVE